MSHHLSLPQIITGSSGCCLVSRAFPCYSGNSHKATFLWKISGHLGFALNFGQRWSRIVNFFFPFSCLSSPPDLTFPLLEDQASCSYTVLTTPWSSLNQKTHICKIFFLVGKDVKLYFLYFSEYSVSQ